MYKTLPVIAICLLAACHGAKQKANEVINKAGETAGQSAAEFVKGVGKGINEAAFEDSIDFSGLKEEGLASGKAVIADSAGRQSVLSVYFIFNRDFNKEILVRVVDKNGLEYGRARRIVAGKKGDAGFTDFYFDGRTSFEGKSKFIFE